ncbi:MAG: hypothetical protein EOM80_18495, partial [Erysipelotrichia bacterium]|nr:hypothetical protein [Erysipelotrichia bacterium]
MFFSLKNKNILFLFVFAGFLAVASMVTASGDVKAVNNAALFRTIMDRLSVLRLMNSTMDDAVVLQKELILTRIKPAQDSQIRTRGLELIQLLHESGSHKEANDFKNLLEAANILSPSAVSYKQPAKTAAIPQKALPPALMPAVQPEEIQKAEALPVQRPVEKKVEYAATRAATTKSTAKKAVTEKTPEKVKKVLAVKTAVENPTVETVKPVIETTASEKIRQVHKQMIQPIRKEKEKEKSQALFPPPEKKESDKPLPAKTVSLQSPNTNPLLAISSVKVTLNFREVELADLVRLLSEKAKMNIISKKPIVGKTTVSFENIPLGTALDTVLKTNNYSYEVREGIIYIFRVGDEPLETRVFFLRHALAIEVLPLVQRSLETLDDDGADTGSTAPAALTTAGSSTSTPAGQADSGASADSGLSTSAGSGAAAGTTPSAPTQLSSSAGRWSLQVDERSNSLIISAPKPKLDEIARLLEVFDVSMENRRLQERIFKLKYIDKDTLVKAIQMVIPRFDASKQMLEVIRVNDSSSSGSQSG